MRYVFSTDDCTIRSTLACGDLLLVFPADEQWLAEIAVRAIYEALDNAQELEEVLRLVRCIHDKCEEN